MKIGFVGVGRMGGPMARFLLQAGHRVTICDPDPAARARARAHGAAEAATIAACVQGAEVVFSSLPDDRTLHAVACGSDGILRSATPGLVYVETSTVSVEVSREIAAIAAERGVAYLRMPVSGNSRSAEAGQVTALASGPTAAWALAKPLVETFSAAQVYVGAGDEARYMKLVINLVVAGNAVLLAEALTLGRKGGLDWDTMLDGLGASAVGSPWLKTKLAALKTRDFSPTFTPAQLAKDLDLMLDAGDTLGVPLPSTALTRQLMKLAIGDGYGEEDFAALVKVFERQAGLYF